MHENVSMMILEKYNVGLKKLLQQGISDPVFYGDIVYRFRKNVGKSIFFETIQKVLSVIKIVYNIDISRLMTKPTKWHVRPAKIQISLIRSESSLFAQWLAKDPSFLHADSEDSDQTGRMPRLI